MSNPRQHVHQLIDRLAAGQLAAVGQLLEVMTDPITRSLAAAPVEDRAISDEEARALDEAHAAIERGEGISHEDITRQFGLAHKT